MLLILSPSFAVVAAGSLSLGAATGAGGSASSRGLLRLLLAIFILSGGGASSSIVFALLFRLYSHERSFVVGL